MGCPPNGVNSKRWIESHYATDKDGTLIWQGTLAEREMLAAIEVMLSAFARISLFFFPARQSGSFGSQRGEALRKIVGIDGMHPVANRELRNHWMHLDERLDREIQAGGDFPVGYLLKLRHEVTADTAARTVRLIDPGAESVYVLGKRYALGELANAIAHIGQEVALALVGSQDGST